MAGGEGLWQFITQLENPCSSTLVVVSSRRCSSRRQCLGRPFLPTVFSRRGKNKRFVSFRFVSGTSAQPNFREASVPGEGEGGHHCARYYRPFIPNKWHSTFSSLSPFVPLFLSFSLVPFNRLRECGEQKGNGKSYLRGGGNLDSLRIEGGEEKKKGEKLKRVLILGSFKQFVREGFEFIREEKYFWKHRFEWMEF